MSRCPKCGEELKADAIFCPNCGFKIQFTNDAANTLVESATDSGDISRSKTASENKCQQTARKVYTADDPTYAGILSDTGLLKPVGRRGRWDYFKVSIFLTLVATVVSYGSSLFSTIIYTYTDFVNTSKRLHDLNQSTKWAVLLSAIRCIIGLYFQFVEFAYKGSKDVTNIFDNIPFIIGIVVLGLLPEIYLLFFFVNTGPNDYGPDPLQRSQQNETL